MNIVLLTGDYATRQAEANRLKAAVYLELHGNSFDTPAATGIEAWVGTNASPKSQSLADKLVSRLSQSTGEWARNQGKHLVGGRANGAIVKTAMPAVLLELFFCSNPRDVAHYAAHCPLYADAILDVIEREMGPDCLVALSVGHVGKKSSPKDLGADVVDSVLSEADLTQLCALELAKMIIDRRHRVDN